MEFVDVVGIDPSLRFTGIARVSYNTENKTYSVKNCSVIINVKKFKGTAAIKNMLDAVNEASIIEKENPYQDVIVESPSIIFNQKFSGGSMISVAHIAGGTACLFGLDKTKFVRPVEWNRGRKKDVTHKQTQEILGDCETWHYRKRVKNKLHLEHILDAASMALWYINENYNDYPVEKASKK